MVEVAEISLAGCSDAVVVAADDSFSAAKMNAFAAAAAAVVDSYRKMKRIHADYYCQFVWHCCHSCWLDPYYSNVVVAAAAAEWWYVGALLFPLSHFHYYLPLYQYQYQ